MLSDAPLLQAESFAKGESDVIQPATCGSKEAGLRQQDTHEISAHHFVEHINM